MRFLLTSDWHIQKDKPAYRTDENYVDTIFCKIEWIFNLAKEKNIKYVLQAGDLFDTHNPPYNLALRLLELIDEYDLHLLIVAGQHDQRYHTTQLDNTIMGLLKTYPRITLLEEEPFKIGDVNIYGAGWGERIPKPQNKDCFNVLVTHKMIVDDKLWKSQESFTQGNIFIRVTAYDLTLSGDNHKTFEFLKDKKSLVNCGSLMRTKSNQVNHVPCVWTFDLSKSNSVQGCLDQHFVEIDDIEEIMDLEQSKIDKSKDSELEEYINKLNDSRMVFLKFTNTLDNVVSESNVNKGVIAFINKCKPKE